MMDVRNHRVRPGYDVQLAMIEGTRVMAFCGIQFVPTVQPGTSGRADKPGALDCPRCDEARDVCREWARVKKEKNRLLREMRALEKLHKSLQDEYDEARERASDPAPQLA